MAVINISLPNLQNELQEIALYISDIEANVPENLLSSVNPQFVFKGSADCSTFYLDDVTSSYAVFEVGYFFRFDLNVTCSYRTPCGDIVTCSSEPMALNGRLDFENTYGDGEYCVSIEVTLTRVRLEDGQETIYTDTFEECLTQKCCLNSLNNLRKELVDCMASFTSTINSYKNIGRSVVKLMERYLKMSNLLWVIDHTDSSCSDYENLKCLFKKI
jgi:hypothetical protein